MWTTEQRQRHDRAGLRYPSDLSDGEWALVEPFIPSARRGGRRRTVEVREVLNGILYVLATGCQWRALPKDLPPRSTVHGYRGSAHDPRRDAGRPRRSAAGCVRDSLWPVMAFWSSCPSFLACARSGWAATIPAP